MRRRLATMSKSKRPNQRSGSRAITDMDVIALVDAAFAACPRPEHFTNYAHCSECAEHDELLRSRDRDTLKLEDVENPGWDPLCFATDEGFKYYVPALVRLALREPTPSIAWYFPQLLFHLTYRDGEVARLSSCSLQQREAVGRFLKHVRETRKALIESDLCAGELKEAIAAWETRPS
jgi:hypothetical protein